MEEKDFINIKELIEGENHRPLLWFALELTKDSDKPVAEFGAGNGSTPYLRQFCLEAGREFISYENNIEWGQKWQSQIVSNWLSPELYKPYSVVLIDQAPGEYRKESIRLLKDLADVIVIHDSEPVEAHGYALHEIWDLFKYKVVTKGQKIWTTALSNTIGFTPCEGMLIGNHLIEKQ